jgi:hypothetical protein
VPITSYSVYEGAQRHSSGNVTEKNGINFGESVRHRVDEKNEFRVDYVGNNRFKQTNLPLIVDDSSKSKLIVKSKSEGARAAPNHSSQLIVASINSGISFHFCEDCRIFCEGVKDDPAITMANHANYKLQLIVECLFLLRDEDNSETMTSSLLLFCVKDTLAIMMAPFANFSLQLIVETPSLLLLRNFERPVITAVMNGSFSFKFIVASHSEEARFAPNFDRPSDLDSSKLIVIFLEISFQFCEDYRIFHEGEYQVKNDGYAIDKQRSANIRICSVDRNSSVDRNGLIGRNDLDNHNGLVKHDGKINPNGPASKLIIICNWTKISLIFQEDCTIFCEGEWLPTTTKMHGDFTYLFNVVVGLVSFIGLGVSFIGGFVGLGLVSLIVFSGIIGVSLTSLVGNNGLVGRIKLFKLSELIVKYPIGLITRISGLVGHNGLVGRIVQNGLVSFIGLGIVGFVGLSLNSLGGLIGHISLVGRCIIGLIESAASSNHRPISLIGKIGLCLIASSASAASLARRLISFVGLIGSSTHRLFCEHLATAVNKSTKITLTLRLKQAEALGVATLQSQALPKLQPQLIISPSRHFTCIRS